MPKMMRVPDEYRNYLDKRINDFENQTGIRLSYAKAMKLELLRMHKLNYPKVSINEAVFFLNLNGQVKRRIKNG